MKHTLLPRLLFLMTLMDSIISMIMAIIRARNKDIQGHTDAMIRCFLYSIEGAGTIRTMATFQAFFSFGPTDCQIDNDGLATKCMYSYVWRLIFTRYLSLAYLGLYNIQRNNKNHKRGFVTELTWFSVIAVCLVKSTRMTSINLMFQLYPYLALPFFLIGVSIARIGILNMGFDTKIGIVKKGLEWPLPKDIK